VEIAAESGSESVMLWGTAAYAGVGRLCKIEGIINWNLYKNFLEEILKRNINYPGTKLDLFRDQIIFGISMSQSICQI